MTVLATMSWIPFWWLLRMIAGETCSQQHPQGLVLRCLSPRETTQSACLPPVHSPMAFLLKLLRAHPGWHLGLLVELTEGS